MIPKYVLSLAILFSTFAFSQLTPVNDSGATMGHVHLLVPDPEAHKKLWVDLFDAKIERTGSLEFLKLPGIVILINRGQPANASGEPTADHFALVVRNLAATRKKLASANIQLPQEEPLWHCSPTACASSLLRTKTSAFL